MYTLLPPQQNVKVNAAVVVYAVDYDEYRLLSDTGNNWRLSTPLVKGECVNDVFRVQTKSGSTYDLSHSDIQGNEYIDMMIGIFAKQGHTFTIVADEPKKLVQLLDNVINK